MRAACASCVHPASSRRASCRTPACSRSPARSPGSCVATRAAGTSTHRRARARSCAAGRPLGCLRRHARPARCGGGARAGARGCGRAPTLSQRACMVHQDGSRKHEHGSFSRSPDSWRSRTSALTGREASRRGCPRAESALSAFDEPTAVRAWRSLFRGFDQTGTQQVAKREAWTMR
jgi:hypothetical protein